MADDVVGSDAAREAKVEETLRKLGVKGVAEIKTQAGEGKPVGPEIKSVLDVSMINRVYRPGGLRKP